MKSRRARASALLLWLVACGGGGSKDDPCAIPTDGAGFLLYAADGDPDPATVNFEIRAIKTDGTCDQLVGAGPDYDLTPSWSRSTGLVAWAAGREGQARIAVQNVHGGAQRLLDTGTGLATGPSISQDGTLVAFERIVLGQGTGDVYVVPVAGGTPAVLAAGTIEVFDTADPPNLVGTCPANDAGPVFSDTPAGRFVYFVSDRGTGSCAAGAQVADVWRQAVDQAGAPVGAAERMTTGAAVLGRPTVAPDGLSFAYARGSTPPASFSKIVLHVVATHQERTVTDLSDSEPAFAPAGDALAIKTTRASNVGDVVVVDLATGAVRKRLTSGGIEVGTPAFSR